MIGARAGRLSTEEAERSGCRGSCHGRRQHPMHRYGDWGRNPAVGSVRNSVFGPSWPDLLRPTVSAQDTSCWSCGACGRETRECGRGGGQRASVVHGLAHTARRARAGPKDSSTNPQDFLPLDKDAFRGRGDGPGPRDHPPTALTGPRTRAGDAVGGRRRKPARHDWRSQRQGAIAAHVSTTNRSPKRTDSSGRTWCQ